MIFLSFICVCITFYCLDHFKVHCMNAGDNSQRGGDTNYTQTDR